MRLDPPVSVRFVNFGIAGGAKYRLVCRRHPDNVFFTKNPYLRSIFVDHPGGDCPCPVDDLMVTFIPDDVHDVPTGENFKPGFNPEPHIKPNVSDV